MDIKGVPIKRIFSVSNIIFFFIKIFIYLLLVFSVSSITIDKVLEQHFKNSYLQMKNIKLRDYDNNDAKKLVCLALDCEYIVEYKNNNVVKILKKTKDNFILMEINDENLNIVNNILNEEITNYMGDIYTHDHHYYDIIRNYISLLLTILAIPIIFSSHFFICFLRIYKGENETSYYKNQLESSLQRDLTENLNHELIPSVLSIESSVKNIYSKIFDKAKIIDYEDIDFNSEEMIHYIKNGTILSPDDIKRIISDHDNIRMSLTKMTSTLNIIGRTKHIKVGNGTISILDIIENVVNGINSLELKKLEVDYGSEPDKEKKTLSSYSTGYEMDNGMMMCVIHNIVKNSVEAHANKITITSKMDDKYIYLKIVDNGKGLRDKFNKLLTKENYKNIFINGYTTKDKEGNNIKKKKSVSDFISSIICRILGIKENYTSERGVGLCLNKKLLNAVGGDIKILDTYYEINKEKRIIKKGTEIEIKFPYKLTKKH